MTEIPETELDIHRLTLRCYQRGGGPLPEGLPVDEAERRRLIRGCERYALGELRPTNGELPAAPDAVEADIVCALLGAKFEWPGRIEYTANEAMVEAARIMGAVKAALDIQAQQRRVNSIHDGADTLTVEHISEVAERVKTEHATGVVGYVRTPWGALDDITVGGFGPGELIYLGARPGVGKTALALEMARHAAESGQRVLIVSREMVNSALVRRIIAQSAKIPARDLKLGKVAPGVLDAGISKVADLPLWLCDKAMNGAQVEMACDLVPDGPQFLIVDYLQLIHGPQGVTEARHVVDRVSWQLKTIAQQREIPVMCLSALTRDADDKPPSLRHLRESGRLEHDASIVLFLHAPAGQDGRPLKEIELIVAKGRDGMQGVIPMQFQGEYVHFLGPGLRGDEPDYVPGDDRTEEWR